jgi:hypothetical protein
MLNLQLVVYVHIEILLAYFEHMMKPVRMPNADCTVTSSSADSSFRLPNGQHCVVLFHAGLTIIAIDIVG